MPFASGMQLADVLPASSVYAPLSRGHALLKTSDRYSSVQRFALIIPCKTGLSSKIKVKDCLSQKGCQKSVSIRGGCQAKSLPLEGKVPRNEADEVDTQKASFLRIGRTQCVRFPEHLISRLSVTASPQGEASFLEERTYSPPYGSDMRAYEKIKPSGKKLFPGRSASVCS